MGVVNKKNDAEKKQIVFSIVIPVYNVEKYIAECIDSVICQSYSLWELILVDDGSTDNSRKICERYADKYENIYLFTKKNSGQADSRNYGITKVTGDYLIFIDSDDFISRYTLELMYLEINRWEKVDVVLSEGMFELFGQTLGGYHNWNALEYQGLSGRDTVMKTMQIAPNWSPCGKCYRMAYWREHNFSFMHGRLAEDFELIERIILESECVSMIPSFYYYRRFRENSTLTRKNKKLKHDELLNFFEWENYFKEKNLDEELITRFRITFSDVYCHDILANMYLFDKAERKEVMALAQKLLFYLKYTDKKDVKLVNKSMKILGFRLTCFCLGVIKRVRIAKERKRYKK